jgi:uncharacterized protein (TIGR03086 family)
MYAVQDQYLRAWERVLAVADGVDQAAWGASSPCAGWTAGHLAGHLVDAARQTFALLAGAPPVLPASEPTKLRSLAADDPAGLLREAAGPLIARVRDLDSGAVVVTPHGELPAEQFLTMALVEPVVHGWDLAVAVGVPAGLDDDAVGSLLVMAQAMGGQLAASGMYAAALPHSSAAEPQEQLLALLGRRAASSVQPPEPIIGMAAGVPFTALPPTGGKDRPAPMIVTWHMLDAPRTDTAFAAALPMNELPAWRVHLGMPMCGARMVDGRVDAALELVRKDSLLAFLAPIVCQAVAEFPAALAALRDQLPVDDGPVSILGASLGGSVALQVMIAGQVPVRSVALVNPAVRIRPGVELVEGIAGRPYRWTAEANRVADELDFVARASEITAQPPLLLVSGEHDHPALRADAVALVDALRERYARPDDIELITVPDLAHPLAEEPGLEPAPQLPATRATDEVLTRWFLRRLMAS